MEKELKIKLNQRVRIAWITIALAALVIMVLAISGIFLAWKNVLLFFAIAVFGNLLQTLLVRKGWLLKIIAYLEPITEVGLITAIVYSSGGFESVFSFLYLIPITTSAVVFSLNAGLGVAILASAAFIALAGLEAYNLIPNISKTHTQILSQGDSLYIAVSATWNKIFIFLGVAALSGSLAQSIEKKREELKKNLSQIKALQGKSEFARKKIEAIVNSVGEGILVVDSKCNIVEINPAAEKIFSLDREKALNKKVKGKIKNRRLENNICRIRNGKTDSFEVTFSESGPIFNALVSPLYKGNKVAGRVLTLRDITEQKELENMKDEFISLVSHQLKTPLSGIRLCLEELLTNRLGKLTKIQQEYLEDGVKNTKKLIELVYDLLDVSRIEAGRVKLEPQPVQLEEIIKSVIKETRGLAKEYNCDVGFNTPKEKLPQINIDPGKIEQVIENLLSNAIKYSSPDTSTSGTAQVEIKKIKKSDLAKQKTDNWSDGALANGALVRRLSDGQAKKPAKVSNYLLVSITDSGIGIPKGEQDRIFSKFFRGSNAVILETEGTGLGLFISKTIIESSEGKIWFESRENKGTTFYFMLPLD